MVLAKELLDVVSCPRCQGSLRYTKEEVLVCLACRLCYPVEAGVPDLSPEAAMGLSANGKIIVPDARAFFVVEEGTEAGARYRLEPGTCRVIGRQLDDLRDTQIFNVDFTMTLDEQTKKLIRNYLASGGGKKKKLAESNLGELGSYRRQSDVILNDAGVSRLHAMIFCDEEGAGILDLVSRNGTYVNNREIEACSLKDGDKIQMGGTRIRFSMKG